MTIRFPDAEMACTAYLKSALPDDVFVGRTRPQNPSKRSIVTVRRQGGQGVRALRRFDSVRLGINVWADTDVEATALAMDVTAAFMAAGDSGLIKRVDISGPAEIEDETGQPRRYFNVEYLARGTATAGQEA